MADTTNEPTVTKEEGNESEEEDDEDDYTDTFSFDVHFCLSKGRCAYTFEEVTANDNGFTVTVSQENSDKTATAEFDKDSMSKIFPHFDEEEATELVGNCFCSIESEPDHALEELQLLAQYGKSRTPPTRDELNERVCTAFASLSDPDFKTNMTQGDKFRYFVSLFDMQVFDNDEVAKGWVQDVGKRVSELSER